MSKRNSKLYKSVYEQHYGSIPRESNGRAYDIHHIDGDYTNNDPKNLIAVTIQEHFNIHYVQDDWKACHGLIARMDLSPEMKSEVARKSALTRVEEGTHPWQKRSDGTSFSSDLVKNGTHNLLKRADGSSVMMDRVKSSDYVNPFLSVSYLGKSSPRYDHTLYDFKNKKSGEIVTMTQRELIDKYDLDHGHISKVISGKRRSHRDWILIDKS